MVKQEIVSPRMSFAGWKLSKWFVGNWKTIKELIKVGVPYGVSLLALDGSYGLGNFLVTIVGKFLIDSGEYFFKRYSA